MGAKLGLVGRHVGIDRAVAFATLAAEAEVERFLNRLAAPEVIDRPAVQHLEQQPGTTACGVSFFTRCLVAWAHNALARVVPAAGPDADAARDGLREAAVFTVIENTADFGRLVKRPHPQVRRDREW